MIRSIEFRVDEVSSSQLPAMLLLAKMGWKPLTRGQADEARGGRLSAVVLEGITREYLRGQTLAWGEHSTSLTEESIDRLIDGLKSLPSDTYGRQAEDMWDRLVLPQSVEQNLNGARRSLNVRLIDFENPRNNLYHLVSEFVVERSRSTETRRPDIVLFVNGIPLVVIENKGSSVDVMEGVSQTIRNQKPGDIPHLYVYAQVLLSVNGHDNRYGTTGTPLKLWSKWREKGIGDSEIQAIMRSDLSGEDYRAIFDDWAFGGGGDRVADEDYLVRDQDRVLVGLCRPDRLLPLMRNFILFDGPNKIIARFQQINAVNKTLKRIKKSRIGSEGLSKPGGVIWHTQGSGKSLTMVMLARALIDTTEGRNARIFLVTDRVDLDKQIKGTFHNTGMEPRRADAGRELVDLIREGRAGVVTTIINKFEAVSREKVVDESKDVFVLVDEGHRTQYGRYHAQMLRVFPNACYVAFTGTPIAKKDRNTMEKFGGLIDTYSMRDAINDGAVVKLVYEGRLIEPDMDSAAIDTWFERLTRGLSDEQKADLKRKYARANVLSKLDKVVACRAFDISEHYRRHFKGTGLKGQLVAPDKKTALKYKQELDGIGDVTSEVLISAPDTRSGHEDVDEGDADDAVVAFWEQMMRRWGNETNYSEGVIGQFKNGDEPEIIIVVSKLLTGFDAPRNAVLYLTRRFNQPETLLQAVARVNRVFEDGVSTRNKEEGLIIDYEGILQNLDNAITSYDAMSGYQEEDVKGIFVSAREIIEDVPQRHGALLDIFKTLAGDASEEHYQRYLHDEEIRENFYNALYEFSKVLDKALGLACFYDEASEEEISRYMRDLKRFTDLRAAVKLRYGERVDFRDYEKRIEKMLHDHILATQIKKIAPPVNIFNLSEVESAQAELESDAAKADMISSNLKRIFNERMDENPALYEKLSKLLRRVIDDFIDGRLAEAEYLNRMQDLFDVARKEGMDEAPAELADDSDAIAFHGYLLGSPLKDHPDHESAAIDFAAFISECFKRHRVVGMFERPDILNKVKGDLDDYIYDTLSEQGIHLSSEEMDEIQERIISIAKGRLS
ncbi:MAG: type I restriction endonuclease subunit R [Ectothiorhodospiraceae bacterium AqS1]|nr:type I restriction endonuclease subunit R [Ectothiorhodospiraceae bacterium AqS1]